MQTSIQHTYSHSYSGPALSTSLWKRFIKWAEGKEKDRFLWLTIGIAGHGFIFTIITTMMIICTGNHFIFWPFALAAMAMCLVVNLAAMSTKITIPVLFLSVLIDLVIIAFCIANGFDISASYR